MSNLYDKINLFVKLATMSAATAQIILDVSPFASKEEINKAYRHKMHLIHPDKFMNSDKKLQQKMNTKAVELNIARDVLLLSIKEPKPQIKDETIQTQDDIRPQHINDKINAYIKQQEQYHEFQERAKRNKKEWII